MAVAGAGPVFRLEERQMTGSGKRARCSPALHASYKEESNEFVTESYQPV